MADRKSVWVDVRTVAYEGSPDRVLGLGCPKCGARLSIRFDANSPQAAGGTAGCLTIRCQECDSGFCWDGLSKTPPWVASLGPTIETQPHFGTDDSRAL
jgi:hypothetical protein